MSDVITELANEANDKAAEIARLKAENAKLLEELDDQAGYDQMLRDILCQQAALCIKAEADNDKLRELVRDMFDRVNHECRCCSIFCSDWDEDNECCVFATSMRELGIEV